MSDIINENGKSIVILGIAIVTILVIIGTFWVSSP